MDKMATEGPVFPERRLVARVTRAERIGPPPYGRTSFEFDGIDVEVDREAISDILENPNNLEPFAMLRVVTTSNAFDRRFGFLPAEGAWVMLIIRPHAGRPGPIAFHSQLSEDGFSRHSRGVLEDAQLIADADDPRSGPKELSASVSSASMLATAVMGACKFPREAIVEERKVRALLRTLQRVDKVQVRDVGQASFVSLLNKDGEPLAHFDAGWPISFNGKTCPKRVPKALGDVPVLLSHWDWDHLHAFYRCPELKNVVWLTPVQELGPGAMKVALQLRGNGLLQGYSGKTIKTPNCTLLPCRGPSRLNDNGFALDVKLNSNKRALLIGDASYGSIGPRHIQKKFDFLVVTHHGADFDGAAPQPSARPGLGIVSVGKGNVYQHPRQSALRKHVGWRLIRTEAHMGSARGDHFLGP